MPSLPVSTRKRRVLTYTVVLVKLCAVLRTLFSEAAENDHLEVLAQEGFVDFGLAEILEFGRSVELSAPADIRLLALRFDVVPVLDDAVSFEPEDVESHELLTEIELRMRHDIIAVGEHPDDLHLGVRLNIRETPLQSVETIL